MMQWFIASNSERRINSHCSAEVSQSGSYGKILCAGALARAVGMHRL